LKHSGVSQPFLGDCFDFSPTESLNQGEQEAPGMTRCIFRKPKRRLKLGHWFGVLTVMLGAALLMELQTGLSPTQQTIEASPLLGQLHRP